MRKLLGLAVVLSCFLLLLMGCRKEGPKPPQNEPGANLELVLPESVEAPQHAPERVSKLTVDGKDFTEPRATKRSIKVEPKDLVTIEYRFWPNTYTNIIRTKKVKVGKEMVKADLTAEDPDTPDQIKPIYFPTPHEVVEAMCKLAEVGPNDVVHDIGCGDGRLVILAVKKFGAKKGVGIDIEDHLVKLSWENAKKDGVTDRVDFRTADALTIKDFSEASVVLLYMPVELNLKLRPILQKTLKPGSRVVSHRFHMGDWEPDAKKTITAKNNYEKDEEYNLLLWKIK